MRTNIRTRSLPLLAAALLLSACAPATVVEDRPSELGSATEAVALSPGGLAPIRTYLNCLPDDAVLVAAHRGTGAGLGAPENSVSGLEALIEAGVMMAEIDVARIRDGTLISFHDGVWDDKASGTGPVVSTPRAGFDAMRLRVREKGPIGGEPVPTLADMLDTAKGRIYLEVDFKTSADIPRVVDALRARGMQDEVILIATDADEARRLAPYADEFLLSLGYNQRLAGHGVWVGGRWRDDAQDALGRKHYRLGSQWRRDPQEMTRARTRLDLLVTDQILRYEPVEGLRNERAFQHCLVAG